MRAAAEGSPAWAVAVSSGALGRPRRRARNDVPDPGLRAASTSQALERAAFRLLTERTSVAGVNLDEEAAKLLQYQQAYQASAKMIQIAQNILTNNDVGVYLSNIDAGWASAPADQTNVKVVNGR